MSICNINMLESCIKASFLIVFSIRFKDNRLSLFLFFSLIFIFIYFTIFNCSYIVIMVTKYDKRYHIYHRLFIVMDISLCNIEKNIKDSKINNIIVV